MHPCEAMMSARDANEQVLTGRESGISPVEVFEQGLQGGGWRRKMSADRHVPDSQRARLHELPIERLEVVG
jgi:hypothetical protein